MRRRRRAFAGLAGLADRWGRANLVVGGLLITGPLIASDLPNAGSRTLYTVLFPILSFVEHRGEHEVDGDRVVAGVRLGE